MAIPEMDDLAMVDTEDKLSEDMDDADDLFWKGVVKPGEPLIASRIEQYFLRITNACLGPDIQKNTRTCLTVVQASDEESEAPGVICTLKNDYENHPLNLLVSDDVQFSVSGENVSPVYLVGYLAPAEKYSVNPFDLGDDIDDMGDEQMMDDEEDVEMGDKQIRKLLQANRKRKLHEMEKDESQLAGEGEEESLVSAQKKTKDSTRRKQSDPSTSGRKKQK